MNGKIVKKILVPVVLGVLLSCDFEEKNIDPNSSTTIEPGPLLTYTQLNTGSSGQTKNIQVGSCMMIVQQASTLERDAMPGDKYFPSVNSGTMFEENYSGCIKYLVELKMQAQKDVKYTNTLGVAYIWGAFLFNRQTDIFGDVPYKEAGLGYYSQNYYPAYDPQEEVYDGMINDIRTGLSMLDEGKPAVKGDLIYNGDLAKWRKFGHSLLLRLGMRISNVNPEKAKTIVSQAVDGGVMTGPEDMAILRHILGEDRTENPLAIRFIMDKFVEQGTVKVSKTFVDQLKKTNDPRLSVYCSLPDGDNSPEKQRGLPNGYSTVTVTSVEPDYETQGHAIYSNFNTATILHRGAPTIFMSSAEPELLLAEAVVKGWAGGNANGHYEKAVRNSMKEQAMYGEAGIISEERIQAYIDQKLFAGAFSTEEKLNVLGTEYWIATFINGYESYANWRRSGYPVLIPTDFDGSPNRGKIPRRLTYSTREYTINRNNLEQAIKRQGADDLNTRIWWDK